MCGILGSINVANTGSLLDLIKHRGPDASGEMSFQIDSHKVHLLHRRLSIVDLSEAGSQPMFTHDKNGCIIFNGEIYNHEELKQKLPEIPFKGHSDTESIINYFNKYGLDNSIQDLNGIFAFAYLDIASQKFYLARDRFGVKPLYYSFQANQLLFSSEIRPLKKKLVPSFDKEALFTGLRIRYIPSPLTLYTNIRKVEPGQILIFDLSDNEIRLSKQYFTHHPEKIGYRKDSFKKLVNEYGDLFEKAVDRQLMADVEVGILLSGGIDSALVAAVAKKKSPSPIKAFTVGFEEGHDKIDEINHARETASILGLEHFYSRIDYTDFIQSFKKIVQIVEEPIGTTSIIPMYSLARLAASKVKVALSGQGADEPLGGYKKYKGLPWLEQAKTFKVIAPFSKLLSPFYQNKENARRLFSAMQEANPLKSYLAFNSIFSFSEIEKITTISERKNIKKGSERFKQLWEDRISVNTSLTNIFLHQDMHTSLSDDLLMYTDKITMHFSLECRVPILDNDLIFFIELLNKKYKFNSTQGKIIHKAFAKEYLPSSIIDRKKLGFQSPTNYWFKKHIEKIKAELSEGAIFNTIFQKDEVMKLLDSHAAGRNLEKQIFLLLSIYYLLEND